MSDEANGLALVLRSRPEILAASGSALLIFSVFAPLASLDFQSVTLYRSGYIGMILLALAAINFALSIVGRFWFEPWCSLFAAYCLVRFLIAMSARPNMQADWGTGCLVLGFLCVTLAATFSWRRINHRRFIVCLAVLAALLGALILNVGHVLSMRVYGTVTLFQVISTYLPNLM